MTILKWLLGVAAALALLVLGWRLYVQSQLPRLVERYGAPVDFATLTRSRAPHDYLRALEEDTPHARPDGPPLLLPQAAPIVARTIETLFGTNVLRRSGNDFVLIDRTPILGFPDFITLSLRDGPHGTRVLAYSTSVYGYGDLGTNRRRVEGMFQVLDEAR